ncbi:phage holin family protein [Providencia alcalifaciens]|nr:phage holin family protein [Providencia alcalifaciens]WGZ54982.1 phage holin family protein [Providencia alcalifaciens]CAG9426026.1 hypothetical protein NVI2019_OHEONHNH_02621 [Providencia alcalifaciens]CAG9429764.1 hypothetical protein NVI2019_PLFLNFOB_03116 [Providencia alcalifaciens]CAG9429955.1 hypothetical protein NVI2019_KOLGMIGM_03117 [Providencia alcalifaciens]CAG9431030.1 hypothetical protein NVI2019_OGMBKCAO_03117 [Providencia alcalifaciens]
MRMSYKEPDNINLLTVMLVGLMTLLGSIASYANKVLKGEPFRLGLFIAQVIISMFAGSMVLLAASYFAWQPEIAGGVAGMAGWTGAAGVSALEKRFLRKVADE